MNRAVMMGAVGAAALLALMLPSGPQGAKAAGLYTNGVNTAGCVNNPTGAGCYPNTLPLTGNETVPADTNLASGANPASEAVTLNQITGLVAGTASRLSAGLVAGDAGQNLWQRGTAGTSTTSATVAWDSADHWGQWAKSSAGVEITKDTTAADLPAGYSAMYALTHTNTTGGQICMGQPLETADSSQFVGNTVEFDFHASTGAGYTGGSTITAYIVYGTGTDEGLNKMAFTVNAGGATGWTNGTLATSAVVPLSAVSSTGRFAAIANIPTTVSTSSITEIGVALCYTAGTTDTNDYVAFTGLQLVRNPTLANAVSTTAAVSSTAQNLTSFARLPQAVQTALQYRYFYLINEADTANVVQSPGGFYDTTTTCSINFPLPAPMFKTPTIVNSAITATTFKISPTAAPVVLAGSGNLGAILQVGSTPAAPFTSASVSFKTTTETQYVSCVLVSTAAGAGSFGFNAED